VTLRTQRNTAPERQAGIEMNATTDRQQAQTALTRRVPQTSWVQPPSRSVRLADAEASGMMHGRSGALEPVGDR
jgi:hypothetical protein